MHCILGSAGVDLWVLGVVFQVQVLFWFKYVVIKLKLYKETQTLKHLIKFILVFCIWKLSLYCKY